MANWGGAASGAMSGAAAGSSFGPWGAAIGGVAGGLMGMFGGGGDAQQGQDAANNINMLLAEKQMAFQRETMQNYHQWEVDDLRKAGLNPILSATHGSVGQPGAMAHVESTTKESSNQSNMMRIAANELFSRALLNKTAAQKQQSESMLAQSQIPINAWNAQTAKANAITAGANSAVAVQNAAQSTSKFGKAMGWINQGLKPFKGILGGSVSYRASDN